MVSATSLKRPRSHSVALFHAGESLLKQVTEWSRLRPNVDIQLASSALPMTLRGSTSKVVAAIIDATEHPEAAMQTLENVPAVMQSISITSAQ